MLVQRRCQPRRLSVVRNALVNSVENIEKENLARHKRHKHKGTADVMYSCEDVGCGRTFVGRPCARRAKL